VQDYALIRAMPNMLIAAPGDPLETRACLRYLVDHPQPSYLRLGKAGEPRFHDAVPEVAPGAWVPVRGGTGDRVLLSTGAALGAAIAQAERDGAAVCSMPLWSMAAKRGQAERVAGYGGVTTFEDHLADGGFGSWLFEAVSATQGLAGRLGCRALSAEVCDTVASQATLNRVGGLTP
jgi:transketolase